QLAKDCFSTFLSDTVHPLTTWSPFVCLSYVGQAFQDPARRNGSCSDDRHGSRETTNTVRRTAPHPPSLSSDPVARKRAGYPHDRRGHAQEGILRRGAG